MLNANANADAHADVEHLSHMRPSFSSNSCMYFTNVFLCVYKVISLTILVLTKGLTSPAYRPSFVTQTYLSPSFTKHSYTKSIGDRISSAKGA
jgi:hypothetical protein